MRRLVLGCALALAFAGVAQAVAWRGPGWYSTAIILDDGVSITLWMGPFETEEACDASREANRKRPESFEDFTECNEFPTYEDWIRYRQATYDELGGNEYEDGYQNDDD